MEQLLTTCLYDRHISLNAQMSPFGGFMMPIQYSSITNEHIAVRTKAGMFDVSHMGEIFVSGPDAEKFVNHIFSNDIRERSSFQNKRNAAIKILSKAIPIPIKILKTVFFSLCITFPLLHFDKITKNQNCYLPMDLIPHTQTRFVPLLILLDIEL